MKSPRVEERAIAGETPTFAERAKLHETPRNNKR